jgi:NAD(P)-dependent dehydrogenase (short-subunit alcohol dehydrogenase family)
MKIGDLFRVEGYGVVVTGGASGIGLGYTEALAANGARVTMLDIDRQRIDGEVQRLRGMGYDVRGTMADVTDHAQLDKAIDEAASLYGRLDVAFANAGIDPGVGFLSREGKRLPEGAIENYDDARWEKVIDINLNGVFATIRAAARHMRPRRFGRIIITTSRAASFVGGTIGAAYPAAKAGAAHLMRVAALELAADGITVNAIAPGSFATNIGGGWLKEDEAQKSVAARVPMHRVAFPQDMAGLALFLASPASSYVTGQNIGIDGGTSLGQAD